MKALAILFTVIFFISSILFGITVFADGVDSNVAGFGLSFPSLNGEEDRAGKDNTIFLTKTESMSYTDIDISILSATVNVIKSSDGETRIVYVAGNNSNYLDAKVKNEMLIIEEKSPFRAFWLPFFGGEYTNSTLTIELPEKEYKSIEYSTLSGSGEINLPAADLITVSVSSGTLDARCAGKQVEVTVMSGKVKIKKSDDYYGFECPYLIANTASGSLEIEGLGLRKYEVSCMSGDVKIDGVAGKGAVSVASGSLEINYGSWNDSLDLSVTSGKVIFTVPKNSGVDLSLTALSGTLKYDLNGENGSFNSKTTTAAFGGSNSRKVNVSITSGSVEFTD